MVKEHGQEHVSNQVEEKVIGYSGDTPVEDYERWNNTKILIHEATFLDDHEGLTTKEHNHSNLQDVMEMAAAINIEKLVLSHFSTRYSEAQIDERIKKLIKHYNLKIPVYRISPGKTHYDILAEEPLQLGLCFKFSIEGEVEKTMSMAQRKSIKFKITSNFARKNLN